MRVNKTEGILTKKFLMEQRQGSYIASNICTDDMSPMFAERIGRSENRQSQWERIKKAGVGNRLCRVFEDEKGYQQWLCLHLIGEIDATTKRYNQRQVNP